MIFASSCPIALISIESGITSVAMSAARTLPSIRNSVAITSSAPIDEVLADRRDRGDHELGAVERDVGDDAGGRCA